MASGKQKRKSSKKPRKPGTPHPDGDRRHRDLMRAHIKSGAGDKRARQTFLGVPEDKPVIVDKARDADDGGSEPISSV